MKRLAPPLQLCWQLSPSSPRRARLPAPRRTPATGTPAATASSGSWSATKPPTRPSSTAIPAPWLSITADEGPGRRSSVASVASARRVPRLSAERYLLAANAFSSSGAEVGLRLPRQGRTAAGWRTRSPSSAPTSSTRGRSAPKHEQVLRATMLFRFERGAWRIVHRHADTMVDLQLPTPDSP